MTTNHVREFEEMQVTVHGDFTGKLNTCIEHVGSFGWDDRAEELFDLIVDDYHVGWGADLGDLHDKITVMAELDEKVYA